jgi:hypothetical protein
VTAAGLASSRIPGDFRSCMLTWHERAALADGLYRQTARFALGWPGS